MSWPKYLCRTFAGIFAVLCAACMNQTREKEPMVPSQPTSPPLEAGQMLDKSTDYGKYWPGQPALFKFQTREPLVLAIPPQFMKFWIQRDQVVRAPVPVSRVPVALSLGFEMFLPDFTGYTPDNYKEEFHEDRVQIIAIEPANPAQAEPGAPGHHVPNTLRRWLESGFLVNQVDEKFGLHCYAKPQPSMHRYCFGTRDDNSGEQILLDIYVPPFEGWVRYPTMQARYYTNRYGGMLIVWRAHIKHLPRWKEIDQKIWKYVDAWNIAPSITPVALPHNLQPKK